MSDHDAHYNAQKNLELEAQDLRADVAALRSEVERLDLAHEEDHLKLVAAQDRIKELEGEVDFSEAETRRLFARRNRIAELEAEVAKYEEVSEWQSARVKARLSRYEQVLDRIAEGPRPDGTYNFSREACQQLAQEALER